MARLVGLTAAVALLAAMAAPLLADRFPVAAIALLAPLGLICHQLPERGWELAGAPLGLCARCLGIHLGALLALFIRQPFRRSSLAVALAVNAATWLLEAGAGIPVGGWERAAAGLLLGGTAAAALVPKRTLAKPRPARSHQKECVRSTA